MNVAAFDAVARGAAQGLSRRSTLASLGAAGALVFAQIGQAKQSAKKKAKKKCRNQQGQCVAALTPQCAGNPDCLALVQTCCPLAGNCDAVGFFQCVAT